ncbi:MAG: transcriptional regulator, partial [Myxococcota bacterium]
MQAAQILEFGPFRLDLTEERLRWRGRPVRLRPKALSLLRHLAERPGELVTREGLIAAIWPDVAVSEATLSDCVREVRRALRDPHDAPRYIETVRGRGYRFVGNAAAPTAAGLRNSEIPFAGREAERG